jgi:hypothetical protein
MSRHQTRTDPAQVQSKKQPSLFLGTPAYNGVSTNYAVRIAKLQAELSSAGVIWVQQIIPGCSFLPHARNVIAAGFLQSGADAAFLIDSDVSVEPSVVFRLLKTGHDYVSAAWTVRNHAGTIRCALSLDPKAPVDATGCIEVPRAGIACTVIRRAVLERIIQADPTLVYDDRAAGTMWNVFGPFIEGRELLHEDTAFSKRWQRAGGKQYVLVDADVEHNSVVMNAARVLERYRSGEIVRSPSER